MVKENEKTTKKIVKTNKSIKKDTKKKTTAKKEKVNKQKGLTAWFKSVFKEVSKVKWPSKKEMVKFSITTIVFVIFFALLFASVNALMAFIETLV